MDYHTLLDLATDLGYELAMCGAETFRVEESINRILASYGVDSEVFAIPNCLTVSIETEDGQILTRMRRIGSHGNDLDSVERFNGLSRAICNRKPDPQEGKKWLNMVRQSRLHYRFPVYLLGNFLGAASFSIFFGGNWMDCICGGICGVFTGNDANGYRFVIGAQNLPLRARAKEITAALNGRGGGSDQMISGAVRASEAEIRAYFTAYTI